MLSVLLGGFASDSVQVGDECVGLYVRSIEADSRGLYFLIVAFFLPPLLKPNLGERTKKLAVYQETCSSQQTERRKLKCVMGRD